jgi:hypothetical protein
MAEIMSKIDSKNKDGEGEEEEEEEEDIDDYISKLE